jgi:chromosome segregation ATPase
MARPLSTSDSFRGGRNGKPISLDRPEDGVGQVGYRLDQREGGPEPAEELENLRSENAQLRSLCGELEQALQEATQQPMDVAAYDERLREYELVLEEKSETIRMLHQQLQEAQAALEDGDKPGRQGPAPREDELLALSEELERERRQIQEDEQSLMEQMRQMEMSMARERAEMARQRNDLQRLYGEIRHEMERLERNGALQSKMDELKAKLQDVQNRRGAAPAPATRPASSTNLPPVTPG